MLVDRITVASVSTRTFWVGAGILAKAGNGGDGPPLRALDVVRAVTTDRRSNGVKALDAMT